MPTDKNAVKAGLFIVVAVVLAAGLLVALQGSRRWFEPTHTVTAAFELTENLGGLKPGDPVRVGGFDQGQVKAVRFVSGQPPHLEVDFTLPKKYELHADATVGVEQALTGAANLNVTDFGRVGTWAEGTLLDGRPGPMSAIYALAPEISGFVAAVQAKVGPAYDRYDQLAANADSATTQARRAIASFNDFLNGTTPDVRGALANLNRATATLNTRLPRSLDKADAFIDETYATVKDARVAVADAKAAMVAARGAIGDAHGLLTRNRARIDNILASVRETAMNLEGASAEIRRSPWRLLYQPSAAEVGNLALYDTTRQFARAAGQLNDAAGAVRDAAAEPGVDRKQLDALLSDLQRTFGKYQEVEQALWRGVK
ncbi:MAG TPA: MlaD family protein [Tepidisphaeraceae bacterium]|jgi:ABC-type transporter Mla subunit MlaD